MFLEQKAKNEVEQCAQVCLFSNHRKEGEKNLNEGDIFSEDSSKKKLHELLRRPPSPKMALLLLGSTTKTLSLHEAKGTSSTPHLRPKTRRLYAPLQKKRKEKETSPSQDQTELAD